MDESIQFSTAAEAGARAQREVDNARGTGIFETYELGCTIVRSSKLYANQRRSNRQLPGGSDSTTAACYMLGGTSDSVLSPLVARVSPCDPREERCKAVERVLKDKTRGAICSLNGDNPREARADNLAAVRICEVVADILVAYAAKRLLNNLQQLYKSNASKDITINALRAQVEGMKRRKIDCWCSNNNSAAPSKPQYQQTSANPAPATPENGVTTAGSMGGLGIGGIGTTRTLAPPPVSSVPTFNSTSLGLNLNRSNAPALPAMPTGSSPLRSVNNPEHHYAGALDAVTSAASQWPHGSAGIERK